MRLLWRLYLSFFLSTLVALAGTAWYANRSVRLFHEEQLEGDLLVRARILSVELSAYPTGTPAEVIARHCDDFGRLTQTRVTVILPDGTPEADSEHDTASMDNHRTRPEIIEALGGRTGRSIRFSHTLGRDLMYVAIPLRRDNAIVAVVRTALPLAAIDWALSAAYRQIALGGLMAGALFAVVALYLSKRVSRPLEDMRRVAERLALGDLAARMTVPGGEELGALARTLNQMAAQLGERLETIVRQSNEQKAVFSSMSEGVLAVDGQARILHLNAAAARLLELVPAQARGRSIHETVRNLDLQKLIDATLVESKPVETEITLYGAEERFLQVHGAALTDAEGAKLGVLVVLNDVTRLKRLETVRRDFVSNVSHELRTPITALKGCVDTLAEGAYRNPDEAVRFLGMMSRQVDRLGAIVADLLSLSRLEHDAEHNRIPLELGSVGDVLRRATQAFSPAAAARRIAIVLQCPGDLTARINAALLEQAVGNLVDNAIKYGTEGTSVTVAGAATEAGIEILVRDQGVGIEKKHLSRIFERFYRVDQARSRALGGTGLGLAIVKHIVLAHRGTVVVESTPGQGSAFTIRIPRQ